MFKRITRWKERASEYPPFTWVAHAFLASQVPVPVMCLVMWPLTLSPMTIVLVYTCLVTAFTIFYVHREQQDEIKHRFVEKDWDKTVGHITARLDKPMDMFGPVIATITLWSAWLLVLDWRIALGLALLLGVLVIRDGFKAIRKQAIINRMLEKEADDIPVDLLANLWKFSKRKYRELEKDAEDIPTDVSNLWKSSKKKRRLLRFK